MSTDNIINIDDLGSTYSADSIVRDEGSMKFRVRPAQFLHAADMEGIENIFFEVFDNALDEATAYAAMLLEKGIYTEPAVSVNIKEDGSVEITDYGRGFPCETNSATGVPAIILAIESDSAGGKNRGTSGYDSTEKSGLHGTGITASMANCEFFNVQCNSLSARGKYILNYTEGKRTTELTRIGDLENKQVYTTDSQLVSIPATGTSIHFKHSSITMSETLNGQEQDFPYIKENILDKIKYNLLGQITPINIIFKWREEETVTITPKTFTPEMELELEDLELVHVENIATSYKNRDGIDIDESYWADIYIGLNPDIYSNPYNGVARTVLNRLRMHKSTTNRAVQDALDIVSTSLMENAIAQGLISREFSNSKHFLNRCRVLIKIRYNHPEFDGQTKTDMTGTGLVVNLRSQVAEALFQPEHNLFLNKWFALGCEAAKHEEDIMRREIVNDQKEELAKKEKELINSTKEKLKQMEEGKLTKDDLDPNRIILIKASRQKKEQSAIVLVEGQSSGIMLDTLHDDNPAGYPIYVGELRGKITNIDKTENTSYDKYFQDSTVTAFVAKILKQGFKEIALMMDGDVDGWHITILVLNIIYQFGREYIDKGNVYIIPTPHSRLYLEKNTTIELEGVGRKSYKKGDVLTFSHEEHKALVSHGADVLKIFTGVGDSDISPINLIKDRAHWVKINKPTEAEIRLLKNMLISGHDLKKEFTKLIYTENLTLINIIRKRIGVEINKVGNIYDVNEYRQFPVNVDFNLQ